MQLDYWIFDDEGVLIEHAAVDAGSADVVDGVQNVLNIVQSVLEKNKARITGGGSVQVVVSNYAESEVDFE